MAGCVFTVSSAERHFIKSQMVLFFSLKRRIYKFEVRVGNLYPVTLSRYQSTFHIHWGFVQSDLSSKIVWLSKKMQASSIFFPSFAIPTEILFLLHM